jgi:hypothetical protein
MKLYIFLVVRLYTQQWYMSYRFVDIYTIAVYRVSWQNKFVKLVHLIGFITKIFVTIKSLERKKNSMLWCLWTVLVLRALLSSYVYLLYYYVCIAVLTLDAGLLARSQYPVVPATGHVDTGFSWFPFAYKRMLRWFPSFQIVTTCFSCSPPELNFLVLISYLCTRKITTATGWQSNCSILLLSSQFIIIIIIIIMLTKRSRDTTRE